jgi:glycosyltransferase involved in cell wall biosynthesis
VSDAEFAGTESAGTESAGTEADVPTLLLHDDARHGVARYAREVAAEVAEVLGRDVSLAESVWTRGEAPERIHAQFTDRLWARSPEDAAERFVALAAGRRVSVTLHDVPQVSDGHAFERRVAAYRRVLDAAELVIVNSRHELALLAEVGLRPRSVVVIPLPAARPGEKLDSLDAELDPVVAVLGWIYPGKGHREAIEAAAGVGGGLAVRALGAPSPGHDADAEALVALGASRGVEVTVSGFLPDDDLAEAARRVAVPLVAHQHFSASGSINSWVSAGRRPLVIRTRYTEEMDALRPGTLTLVDAEDLAAAVSRAYADPSSTFLAPGSSTRPHPADTARASLDAWRGAAE